MMDIDSSGPFGRDKTVAGGELMVGRLVANAPCQRQAHWKCWKEAYMDRNGSHLV